MSYRMISPDELTPSLFSQFDRTQEVARCLRKRDGRWVAVPCVFTEKWGEAQFLRLCQDLRRTLSDGGFVAGLFIKDALKGFCSVENVPMGIDRQSLELSSLHVSRELRGQGHGRALFSLACDWASAHGARWLYISTHSSVESQAFYEKMGCVDAREPDPAHVAAEPYDRQLERDLSDFLPPKDALTTS